MAKSISPVIIEDASFETWVNKTNEIIEQFDEIVTVSTANGDLTVGNGYIVGVFGSDTLVATALRGGNVSASANLAITSNVAANGTYFVINTAITSIASANLELKSNNSIVAIKISGNSTSTNTQINGNTVYITANGIFNGSVLSLPTGNTGQRPTARNGSIRYNDEQHIVEVLTDGSWRYLVATVGTNASAGFIDFQPNGNVHSVTVQDAIYETWEDKVSKIGDTMTGKLNINIGATPLSVNGAVIQLSQADTIASVIASDSISAASGLVARRADGTSAAKTALASGDHIFTVDVIGRGASDYTSPKRAIRVQSSGAWTDSSNPTVTVIAGSGNSSGGGAANTLVDSLFVYGTHIVANAAAIFNYTATFSAGMSVTGNSALSNATANVITASIVNATNVAANSVASVSVTANNFFGNGAAITSVNAALLNGQNAAYYTDIVARLGFAPVAESTYTGLDILSKLLAVDGSGSNLDADLLDGQHGSYYANAANLTGTLSPSRLSNTAAYSFGSTSVSVLTSTGSKIIMADTKSFAGDANTIGAQSSSGSWLFSADNSGNFTSVGNISAYSDKRLKTDISTIDNALDKVLALRGVYYTKDGVESIGVIAQEVQRVIPEVVFQVGEYLAVSYGNLVGLLIESTKEQSKKIASLEDRIATLENLLRTR